MVSRAASPEKITEIPTRLWPLTATVSPRTRESGPQVLIIRRTRLPEAADSPALRQERLRRHSMSTAMGTTKVTRPSMVWMGRTRILPSTPVRTFWTSLVTALVVELA